MGSDSDGDRYESLATLFEVAIAAFVTHKTHKHYYYYYYYYYSLSRARTDRHLRHVFDARGRRERRGESTLPARSVHSVFPLAPRTKHHLRVG